MHAGSNSWARATAAYPLQHLAELGGGGMPPRWTRLPRHQPGFAGPSLGDTPFMIWLLLILLIVLAFGVWGAIKLTLWVLLIALLVAAVAGFLGRGLFARA